jgi:hypothetical protein
MPPSLSRAAALLAGVLAAGCAPPHEAPSVVTTPFASDLAFLRQHTQPLVLGGPPGAQIVVAPEYQGRVMTSTTGGADAPSFGWIGRAAIAARSRQPHMNVFGGEDRFWLGPEGGQFSLYFRKADPFDLDHWQVPEGFDWGAWGIESQSASSVGFRKRLSLRNYSDTAFEIDVARTVRLLDAGELVSRLGLTPAASVRAVAFESSNVVKNAGPLPWRPESGLVSTWILGQFTPSATTTIVIPFTDPAAGPVVNDAYFGKVPGDRLVIRPPRLFFRGDGQYRSKIGLPPSRATAVAGSYDSAAHVLTVVQFTRPADASRYVNSMWEIQKDPYSGDVINSYNDGPPAPGKPPLGPFYELETSSPALSLAPGEQYEHVHRTFHFAGAAADLEQIARATLGVGLADITAAFASAGR